MILSIRDLQKDEGRYLPFSGAIALDSDADRARGLLKVNLQAAYVSTRVLVKGKWRVDLQGECSRCLDKFNYYLEDSFREEFTHLPGPAPEAEGLAGGLELEKGERYAFRGETLDLSEYFRQLFFMSQPLKILCREDCQGLCPLCGVNRNREQCNCRQDEIDPRWAALEKMKKQL
ncbi:MAG: DUF177 domain-containing protein [Firmicutes bacterium]|nr:DUF177 domain-containing protein [Bacillota bacterium]